LCPHSDRAFDKKMSYSTFVMTNVIPQAPNLNQKAWNQLEIYLRELVQKKNRRLYVIAGPAGTGGRGKLGFQTDVAEERVTVPAKCWKIAVVVEGAAGNDLEKINADTRVIAVVMPNDNGVGFTWAQYRTSVKQIEKLTGYTFFDALPADVAKALKEGTDDDPIPPPVPVQHDDD
jgi:endonuclease G, mitochondrial